MFRPRIGLLGSLVALPLLLALGAGQIALSNTALSASSAPAAHRMKGCPLPRFDRTRFPAVPRVDNNHLPLVPGRQYTLDGLVVDETGRHPHRIVTTVTDLTKVINGVRTIVVWDVDYQDGKLTESELFFNGQDRSGNVWLLGEYPAEYDNGTFTGAPATWISGAARAKPGIALQAHSVTGTRAYRQGYGPSVGFYDCAKVFSTGQSTTVPAGTYRNVVVTDEWGPLDPTGGHQRKYYAPGVGTVRVGAVGGKAEEDLVLTKAVRLCKPAEVAEIRRQALALDKQAYQSNSDVYGTTPPAQHTLNVKPCGM